MKQINSLLDLYRMKLNMMTILMPLVASVLIVMGIIAAVKIVYWFGLILIAVGLIMVVAFIFMRKHMIKIINELENKELLNGD